MLIHANKKISLELKSCGINKGHKYTSGYQYENSRVCQSPSVNKNFGTEEHYSFYNSKARFSHSEVPERNYSKEYLKESYTYETPAHSIQKDNYVQRYEHVADAASKRPVTADYK